jgi:hypothetical protein
MKTRRVNAAQKIKYYSDGTNTVTSFKTKTQLLHFKAYKKLILWKNSKNVFILILIKYYSKINKLQ